MECDFCGDPIACVAVAVGLCVCPGCFDANVKAQRKRRLEQRAGRPGGQMSLLRLMVPAVSLGGTGVHRRGAHGLRRVSRVASGS